MRKMFFVSAIGSAITVCSPLSMAREVVVLPGVVSPVGESSGVDTQGPGTLTVGSQNINTGNDAGGGITTTAANTANIVFTGSSSVTGFVGATGTTFLNISAGANANTVNFSGPVYSTTFSVAGTGTVNFNGGFISNTGSTMDFAGDGFINVAAGQTVKAAITNSAGASTGTLTLNGGSILDGAVGAASGLKQINVVGGNALITGQVNAASYTLGTNTLNVGGAFAIPVAGTINTTIFSQSLYGKIVPTGSATIGDALQVNVTVTGPIANGTSFNIVDATSGTNGSTVIANSNTTRYLFTAAPTTNGQVVVTTTQIPLVDVVTPVVTPPPGPGTLPPGPGTPPVVIPPGVNPFIPIIIAPVIDALPETEETLPILVAITLLPNAPAVANALAQLAPSTASLMAPQVNYRATQRLQDLWASHLTNAQPYCVSGPRVNDEKKNRLANEVACRPENRKAQLWGTSFGHFGNQGSVNGFEGYDSDILGGMLAYDAPVGDAWRLGAGLRYAQSTVEGNTSVSEAEIESYQATAYVGYARGPWFTNAALVFGIDDYSTSRTVVFPGVNATAEGDFKGRQYTASGSTGYHYYIGDGSTVLTPIASLQYTRMRTKAHTETGGGAINLAVAAQTYEFVQSGLGGKLSHNIPLSGQQLMRPEIHAYWLHSFGGETMSSTAAFASGGQSFTTVGLKPKRDTYNVGAGVAFVNNDRWSVEGVYDYQWRADSYSAHQAMVKFVLRM